MTLQEIKNGIKNISYGSAGLLLLSVACVVIGGVLVLIHNMWVNIHPAVAVIFCTVTLLPLSYFVGDLWISFSSPSIPPILPDTENTMNKELFDDLLTSLISLNEVYADASSYSLEELVQQSEVMLEKFNLYCTHMIGTNNTFLDNINLDVNT